ncbi:MAG: ribosome small subunit-dependent GTPase A [Firmicutes bacterium]|nr:ribosome small subunit-dependent GTPase A [Bacillota bacterium]
MTGEIVKGIGGFYYVATEEGVYQCRARGLFKKKKITPTVGDQVKITVLDDEEAVIDEIFPRSNLFVRPAVSNVDLMITVVAAKDPAPNAQVIDRMLVTAEKSGTDAALCINKTDLSDGEAENTGSIYENIYPVIYLSCVTGEGIEELKELIRGKRVALTGPSGVGKSTILNTLKPEAEAETGTVSDKTQRGRHTTRHVEIFDLPGGTKVYDTPGFTSFEMQPDDGEDVPLDRFFPEMEKFLGHCRYDNCRHMSEPGCRIKEAVENGEIHKSRYQSYLKQMEDLQERK